MSYCVQCGVELDSTAGRCPLCGTPVYNPNQPVDRTSPPPFPAIRQEVAPIDRRELAVAVTAVLLSASVFCILLNLILVGRSVPWSAYVTGAAALLWCWSVPHLLARRLPVWARLAIDGAALALYLLLIALLTGGLGWYWSLALPVTAALCAASLALCAVFRKKPSLLSAFMAVILCIGLFLLVLEFFIDFTVSGSYRPFWSLIAFGACLALIAPLLVVRLRPGLRSEVRRRFHF